MKVAHIAVCTPNRCGLYETTRELVAGLRKRGVDSRLVDPAPDKNPVKFSLTEDRGAPVDSMDWANKEADIVVSHSGTVGIDRSKPIVYVAHGRPRSSFLIEKGGGTAVYSWSYQRNFDAAVKAVVTFWPEHLPYLQVMMPDKPIHVVKGCVDLDFWSPGPKKYGFNGKAGRINVVCSDAWRDDVDPYYPLNAFALWAREIKGAKLHLYGKPAKADRGWSALIRRIQDDGNMGEIRGWVQGLREVYRAADFVLTGNEIDVRTVREASACGCPVVRVGSKLNGFRADIASARDEMREFVRLDAERRFNPDTTAQQFHAVLEGI